MSAWEQSSRKRLHVFTKFTRARVQVIGNCQWFIVAMEEWAVWTDHHHNHWSILNTGPLNLPCTVMTRVTVVIQYFWNRRSINSASGRIWSQIRVDKSRKISCAPDGSGCLLRCRKSKHKQKEGGQLSETKWRLSYAKTQKNKTIVQNMKKGSVNASVT